MDDDALTPLASRWTRFRRYWYSLFFVEVWLEKREIWKELIFHAALYFVCLAVLELGHQALEHSSLPQGRKDLIDAVHFYLYLLLLVNLGADFIMKAYRVQFPRKRDRQ